MDRLAPAGRTRAGRGMSATGFVETAAGVPQTGPLADALATRAKLMARTEESRIAALTPDDPGGLPLPLRAALAARMARLCGDPATADRYAADAGDDPSAALADPAATGGDARAAAILAYVDCVTLRPAEAGDAEIDALRDAGVEEGDIVRLAGLVAFVNYQLRLIAVLRAMGQAT